MNVIGHHHKCMRPKVLVFIYQPQPLLLRNLSGIIQHHSAILHIAKLTHSIFCTTGNKIQVIATIIKIDHSVSFAMFSSIHLLHFIGDKNHLSRTGRDLSLQSIRCFDIKPIVCPIFFIGDDVIVYFIVRDCITNNMIVK